MTVPPEAPRYYELELTTLELSMLTQALILMLPQIERSTNAATGEEVTTQSLIMKLVGAGMAANAREDLMHASTPLTDEDWIRLDVGDILQHVVSGEAYTVRDVSLDGPVRLIRTLHAMNPQEWRLVGHDPDGGSDA